MAEYKRFTNGIHRIYENGEEIACADTMDDAGTIVDKLNEQEELISYLRKELIKYKPNIFDDVDNYYNNKTYTYEGPMPDVRY